MTRRAHGNARTVRRERHEPAGALQDKADALRELGVGRNLRPRLEFANLKLRQNAGEFTVSQRSKELDAPKITHGRRDLLDLHRPLMTAACHDFSCDNEWFNMQSKPTAPTKAQCL
ncbi:MAG TPA: hypothetical protein VHC73_06120 [Vitreimonas sp.]|nr:hypothetical protein [Vitreimonas sp.]